MGLRLSVITSSEVIRKLTKAGFRVSRQRGSHLRMERISDKRMITIPVHF
ncbi:MAG TPA: type II toxin-antitoxin system HicA family toxin [Bacteroidota bacterium]